MGAADIATVLFTRFLKFDPAAPHWPDRDRFVLSAGHGSMLLYALLYLTGTPGMTLDELKRFRQLGLQDAGPSRIRPHAGVETTTGPLGQGIATAVGIAHRRAADGGRSSARSIVDHHTYVLASDGDLMEGISQEAIALAGHLGCRASSCCSTTTASRSTGRCRSSDSVDQVKRFEAAGWRAERIDGHDPDAIAAALERAQASDRPSLIACKTIIGYGAPKRAGTSKAHGEPLGAEELAGAKAALNLSAGALLGAAGRAGRLAQRRRALGRGARGLAGAAGGARCRHARRIRAAHRAATCAGARSPPSPR